MKATRRPFVTFLAYLSLHTRFYMFLNVSNAISIDHIYVLSENLCLRTFSNRK